MSDDSYFFFQVDDERYVKYWKDTSTSNKLAKYSYDIIVFNFAVNRDKALYFCKNLLAGGDDSNIPDNESGLYDSFIFF